MTRGRVDIDGQVNRPSDEHSAIPAPGRFADTDVAANVLGWNRACNTEPGKAAAIEDAGCRQGESQNHAAKIPATAKGRTEVLRRAMIFISLNRKSATPSPDRRNAAGRAGPRCGPDRRAR